MGNFFKNLHPLLRRDKNKYDNEDPNYAILHTLNDELNNTEKDALESKLQSSLKTATGKYLDKFGEWFDIYRKHNEKDDNYRARIIKKLLYKKGTNNAIIEGIKDYLEKEDIDISIYEPFKNIFFTNKSTLNGEDHLMGEYYRFAVINVTIGSYFPVELIDVINNFKPAGVKLYVTYDGAINNTGTSVITEYFEPIKVQTYQNVSRFTGYDYYFNGYINLGLTTKNDTSTTSFFRTNRSKLNSSDILVGSPTTGRNFYNYAYIDTKSYLPELTDNTTSVAISGTGKEMPKDYYISTIDRNNIVSQIDIEPSSQNYQYIYHNFSLYYFLYVNNPQVLLGITGDAREYLSKYLGSIQYEVYANARVSIDNPLLVDLQLYDFTSKLWVTVKSSELTMKQQNIGADLGYVFDYLSYSLNIFSRIRVRTKLEKVQMDVDYVNMSFSHREKNIYSIKPAKSLVDTYRYVDNLLTFKTIDNIDTNSYNVLSKVTKEPLSVVKLVGTTLIRKTEYGGADIQNVTATNFVLTTPTTLTYYNRWWITFDIETNNINLPYHIAPVLANGTIDYNQAKPVVINKGRVAMEIDLSKVALAYASFRLFTNNSNPTLTPVTVSIKNISVTSIPNYTSYAPVFNNPPNHSILPYEHTIDGTYKGGSNLNDGNILAISAYTPTTNFDYPTKVVALSKPIQSGKKYTIQLKGKISSESEGLYIHNTIGGFLEIFLSEKDYDPEKGLYVKTFVAQSDDIAVKSRQNKTLQFYSYPQPKTEPTWIEWVKIEEVTKENLAKDSAVWRGNNVGLGTLVYNSDGTKSNYSDPGKTLSLYISFLNGTDMKSAPVLGKRYYISFEMKASIPGNATIFMGHEAQPMTASLTTSFKQFTFEVDYNIKRYDAFIMYFNYNGATVTYRNIIISEVTDAQTPPGNNVALTYASPNLPVGSYKVNVTAKVDVLEGQTDEIMVLDYPTVTASKTVFPIIDGYLNAEFTVNRTDDQGAILLYAGLYGSTAGKKVKFTNTVITYSNDNISSQNYARIFFYDKDGNDITSQSVMLTSGKHYYDDAFNRVGKFKSYLTSKGFYGDRTDIAKIKITSNAVIMDAKLQAINNVGLSDNIWRTIAELGNIEPTTENPTRWTKEIYIEDYDLYQTVPLVAHSTNNEWTDVTNTSIFTAVPYTVTTESAVVTDIIVE